MRKTEPVRCAEPAAALPESRVPPPPSQLIHRGCEALLVSGLQKEIQGCRKSSGSEWEDKSPKRLEGQGVMADLRMSKNAN